MNTEEYLRANNIKITKGRVSIFNILTKSKDALTVEYIYEECKIKSINIDLSTVYRTLELFKNKKIVDKFDLGHGKYNYIINNNRHKHILECTICHKEVEIDCPMQQVEQMIKNKTGFTILDDNLNFKLEGICRECINKN
ncbi:Fur family transcriptional regulator [Clostridium rectalis]|uniref:Fur family transcriptional regulator n=1 Tax=Clostridium rectalis TaxID=2040295 RepID=UPI000F63BC0D|nr:transcriptional repressor [Clostridium rectalis]